MGRWSYSNRLTVEDCHRISTTFLKQHNYFDGGVVSGRMSWSCIGKKTGSIGFIISTVEGDEYIRLSYTQTDRFTTEESHLDYTARLESTPCNFGGRRWWFICPLIVSGHACNRRVGVLYLGGGKYFGCRHCYDLTYQSSQDSHKFDSLYRGIGVTPEQVKEFFK